MEQTVRYVEPDKSATGDSPSVDQSEVAKSGLMMPSHQDRSQDRQHSYSVGAIPTDAISKKRVSGRMAAQEEFAKRAMSGHVIEQTGYKDPYPESACLPRPYPLTSYGYAPKEVVRSMGSTALPREETQESQMAKGDNGRQRQPPPPHGMSRSLPKQSYFPDQQQYSYPSRSAVCLSDNSSEKPTKRGDAYYSPQIARKTVPEYYARLSSSSAFKPKQRESRYYEPVPITAKAEEEHLSSNQWVGYQGGQRWVYDGAYVQPQYAVHMVQETTGTDAFREGGDTAIMKSSGDSTAKFVAVSADALSSTYVYVRDAQTGPDSPLPAGRQSPVKTAAEAKASSGSSSSSGSSEDESSSESSTSGSSESAPTEARDSQPQQQLMEKKKVHLAEPVPRLPAEGSSLRSFRSDVSSMEQGRSEDTRSLLSTTNMVTPLLRPLIQTRKKGSDRKTETFCIVVNVVLLSVLLGIIAAYVVQQVNHSV